MKLSKSLFASLAFLAAFACTSVSAQNKFVTNQVIDDNTTLGSATPVNVNNLARIDANCSAAKTIALTYADGSVKNWTYTTVGDCNTVLDKFNALTGSRANGALLYYTSQYGTNIHIYIPYSNVFEAPCAATQGGTFYTATITLRTGGAPIVSNGNSSWVCGNFN